MKQFWVLLLTVPLFSGFVTYTQADVVIKSTNTSFEDPRDSGTSTAYLGSNGMRVETQTEGESMTMIFRSDKEVFWVINTEEKSYTEMTRKDIKQIKSQMDEATRMMQEQMKNMPPEQRAMIEEMMKGQAMPAPPEKKVFKKVASGVTVRKWKCDKYESYSGKQLTEEVWTTSSKNLGIGQKDFRIMQSMAEFMSELSPEAASLFTVGSEQWEKEQGYPGIPVRIISYSNGKKVFQMEIQDVKNRRINPSRFNLPKGLTKQSLTGDYSR
jgi:hypothetical protein